MYRIFAIITICLLATAADSYATNSTSEYVSKKRFHAQQIRQDLASVIARYKNPASGTNLVTLDPGGVAASNSGASLSSDETFEPNSIIPASGGAENSEDAPGIPE